MESNDRQSKARFFFNHSKREGSLFIVKFFTSFPLCFISYYYQKHMILSSYSKIITSWKMNISESLKKLKFYTVRASFSILKRRAELSVNSIAIGFCLR